MQRDGGGVLVNCYLTLAADGGKWPAWSLATLPPESVEWGREFVISLLGLVGASSNWSGHNCGGKENDPYHGRKHTRHIWNLLYWLKYLCVRKEMRKKLWKFTSCPWWVWVCSWHCDQFWHMSPVIQSWLIKWYHFIAATAVALWHR
jgi:hypothetical protein